MSDEKKHPDEEQPEPVAYATPVKRVWAWVGVAYMLIIVLIFTWFISTARFLYGLGPLMVIPALCGILATVLLRYRSGQAKGGLPVCILFAAACAALIILNLVLGIPSLLANFGG